MNKHLIMWIRVQAKLNLKGLPGLIIEFTKEWKFIASTGNADSEMIS